MRLLIGKLHDTILRRRSALALDQQSLVSHLPKWQLPLVCFDRG